MMVHGWEIRRGVGIEISRGNDMPGKEDLAIFDMAPEIRGYRIDGMGEKGIQEIKKVLGSLGLMLKQ